MLIYIKEFIYLESKRGLLEWLNHSSRESGRNGKEVTPSEALRPCPTRLSIFIWRKFNLLHVPSSWDELICKCVDVDIDDNTDVGTYKTSFVKWVRTRHTAEVGDPQDEELEEKTRDEKIRGVGGDRTDKRLKADPWLVILLAATIIKRKNSEWKQMTYTENEIQRTLVGFFLMQNRELNDRWWRFEIGACKNIPKTIYWLYAWCWNAISKRVLLPFQKGTHPDITLNTNGTTANRTPCKTPRAMPEDSSRFFSTHKAVEIDAMKGYAAKATAGDDILKLFARICFCFSIP